MPKPRYKTTNWNQYNQSLINSGSLTFWMDEEAISQWQAEIQHNKIGRLQLFSDMAITTTLVFFNAIKSITRFIDSVFILAQAP
ncbi:transposase (fragment) [Vibrio aestuarianus]